MRRSREARTLLRLASGLVVVFGCGRGEEVKTASAARSSEAPSIPPRAQVAAGLVHARTISADGLPLAAEDVLGMPGRSKSALAGHDSEITAVAFSADGKGLATADLVGSVKLWDLADGTLRATYQDDAGRIRALRFVEGGATLVSAGNEGLLVFRDLGSGRAISKASGHTAEIVDLVPSPDGRALASSGLDGAVRLWDVGSKALRLALEDHVMGDRALTFSPDGRSLISANRDGQVVEWDASRGQRSGSPSKAETDPGEIPLAISPDGTRIVVGDSEEALIVRDRAGVVEPRRLEVPGTVTRVAFSPDGKTVAAGCWVDHPGGTPLGLVLLWDAASWGERARFIGHPRAIRDLAFSADGDRLATVGFDRVIRIWDAASGTLSLAFDGSARPEGGPIPTMSNAGAIRSLAYSPDGRTVAVAGEEGIVRLWDVAARRASRVLTGGVGKLALVAFSPDGKTVAAAGESGGIRLWDPESGREQGLLAGQSSAIYSLAFSPDGASLVAARSDGSVAVWDLRAKAEAAILSRHTSPARVAAFAPDGRTLASGGDDFAVKVGDVSGRSKVRSLEGHRGAVVALAYAPDGLTLASAGEDGDAILWDAGSKVARRSLKGQALFPLGAAAFSPDGQFLVTGDEEGTIKFWEAATGRPRATRVQAHLGAIRSLAFSPDGKDLASGGDDRELKTWKVDDLSTPRPFEGHTSMIMSLAYSPDGTVLATGGFGDRLVKLWDVATGRERASLTGHTGRVLATVFSPDGSTLATASDGRQDDRAGLPRGQAAGEVKLWDVAQGRELPPLADEFPGTFALAFSPDGKALAAAGEGEAQGIRIWDLATRKSRLYSVVMGRPMTTMHNPYGVVRALAFTPDGRTLVGGHGRSWNGNGNTVFWDPVTGYTRGVLGVHTGTVTALNFSADGRTLVAGGDDRRVLVWNLLDGPTGGWKPVIGLAGARSPIRSLTLSPGDRTIAATTDADRAIYLWNMGDIKPIARMPKPPGTWGSVFAGVAFSPDGKVLASGGDRVILTTDAAPGSRDLQPYQADPHEETATLSGHDRAVLALQRSEDGRTLVSGGGDGVARVWDVASRRERKVAGPGLNSLATISLSTDGSRLAAGTWASTADRKTGTVTAGIRLWDLGTGRSAEVRAAHADLMKDVVFTPDGRTLISASQDGTIRLWDAEALAPKPGTLRNEEGVQSLSLSPDGKILAVESSRSIGFWEVASGRRLSACKPPGRVRSMRFSPDGRTLAIGGDARPEGRAGPTRPPGALTLWDVAENRPRFPALGQRGGINGLAFSPDGLTLASASEGNQVVLWDPARGEAKSILRGHTGAVKAVSFSPDGKLVASGGRDGVLMAWDARSGRNLRSLRGHDGEIESLVFLPDNATIATAGSDSTIKFWDARATPSTGPEAGK